RENARLLPRPHVLPALREQPLELPAARAQRVPSLATFLDGASSAPVPAEVVFGPGREAHPGRDRDPDLAPLRIVRIGHVRDLPRAPRAAEPREERLSPAPVALGILEPLEVARDPQ